MLPFTAEILFSSVAQYNRALWPLPALALLLCLGGIALALRPIRSSGPAIGVLLAAAWLWTGVGWHLLHFARLDFAAPIYGAFFVLQGLLLVWAVVRGRLAFRFDAGLFGWVGVGVAVVAAAWPLIDWLSGQNWPAGRVVGLAPAPTVVLTFGMLLLAEKRAPSHLAIIPLLWALVAGATAWILAIPQDLALPAVGVGGFGLLVWKNRCLGGRLYGRDEADGYPARGEAGRL
jgi:Family of unknown function (DUF6064)